MKTISVAGILAVPLTATLFSAVPFLPGCKSPEPAVAAPALRPRVELPPRPRVELPPATARIEPPVIRPVAAKPLTAATKPPPAVPETPAELEALLDAKPDLANNQEFIKRYSQAKARSLYFSGKTWVDRRDWQQAVVCFEQSVALNPLPETKEALAAARTLAAKECQSRAIQAATGGDLSQARQWIDKGLAYSPDNADFQQARKTLDGAGSPTWQEATALEKEARLCGALRKCEEILAAEPQHLAALAATGRLRQQIAQCQRKLAPVDRLIANGDLDEATRTLTTIESSCRDLPELVNAKINLSKAIGGRGQILRDIDSFVAAGRWDDALAKVKEAKALVSDTSQLNKKAQEIRKAAASSYKEAASKRLNEQQYAEAKKQLRLGAAFVSESEARDLWQQFWIEGGGILDRKGHAGAAYLWYSQGVSMKADPDTQQQLNDLTEILMRQYSYRIDASLQVNDQRLQIEANLLKQALAAAVQRLPGTHSFIAANPAAATNLATLTISVSDIRMDSEPRFFRKASQVRNYTKADGERGRWEYTVEEYRKTGEIGYSMKLNNGRRDLFQPTPLTWNWYVSDQIIDRPNPSLGLRDAVLNLPANDDFRNLLFDRFASTLLNSSVSLVFENLVARLEMEASKQKEIEASLDLHGTAYLLLLQNDSKRAASLLQEALKF